VHYVLLSKNSLAAALQASNIFKELSLFLSQPVKPITGRFFSLFPERERKGNILLTYPPNIF